jgi:hypothetical protein
MGALMDGSRHTLLVSGVVRWPSLDSGRARQCFPSNLVRLLDSCGAFENCGYKGIVCQQTRMLRSSKNMVLQKMIEVEDAPPLLEL